MDKRTVLSSIALLSSSSAVLYIYNLHRSLSHQVNHKTHSGPLIEWLVGKSSNDHDATPLDAAALLLPEATLQNPSAYTGISDRASLSISTASIPRHKKTDNTPTVLTQYLRFTMTHFSRFPQFYIMKFMYRSQQDAARTFDAAHIARLDFTVGDVVNGGYQVVSRTETQVVFAMVMPEGVAQGIDGRLAVGLRDEGEETVFYSHTLQWKRKEDEKTVLPLERGVARWLHEFASWWLLVEGTRYVSR